MYSAPGGQATGVMRFSAAGQLSQPYPGPGNLAGDPGLLDPEGTDGRLRADSRLIGAAEDGSDIGALPFTDGAPPAGPTGPGPTPPGSTQPPPAPTLDLRGPVIDGPVALRSRVRPGGTARFVAVTDEKAILRLTLARERRTVARRVVAAKAGTLVRIAVHVPLRARPGRYAVRLVATDAAGNATRARTTHVTVQRARKPRSATGADGVPPAPH
jgi:hypothetical protein